MEIGTTIRNIRKRKGLRQNELAERTGISQTYLSQIENGSRSASLETLEKISTELKVPLPILSFLSLDINTISPNKRKAFKHIEPAIKALIEEFFLQEE